MMHRDPNLPAQPESAARLKGRFRTTLWIVVVIACALILFLRFGGDILVHTDPLPRHADVAVVLNGSALGVRARTQGAVQLLKQGIVLRHGQRATNNVLGRECPPGGSSLLCRTFRAASCRSCSFLRCEHQFDHSGGGSFAPVPGKPRMETGDCGDIQLSYTPGGPHLAGCIGPRESSLQNLYGGRCGWIIPGKRLVATTRIRENVAA